MTPDRAAAEEQEAQDYAHALRTISANELRFWRTVNAYIIDRWSLTALKRIKRRAWDIYAERQR